MKLTVYDRRADDRRKADRREEGRIARLESLVEECSKAEAKLLEWVDDILRANGVT